MQIRYHFVSIMLLTALLGPSSSLRANEVELASQNETQVKVPAAFIDYNPDAGTNNYFFVVDKSARELSIWSPQNGDFKFIKSFPTDIGKNSSNKKKEGDHATPEGIYFLQSKLEGNEIDYSLYGSTAFTTDYPNVFDKVEDKTGTGIWLHAIPDQVPLTRGSRGCVVVRDNVIKELKNYVTLGTTPIMIFDKVATMDSKERAQKKAVLTQFINSWKDSWSKKNLDQYISFYHDKFKGLGMNKDQWLKHKSRLATSYANIEIQFSAASIFNNKNEWVVRMIQNYKSDKYQDSGYKTLYVIETGGQFKIVSEEFQKLSNTTQSLVFKTISQTEASGSPAN